MFIIISFVNKKFFNILIIHVVALTSLSKQCCSKMMVSTFNNIRFNRTFFQILVPPRAILHSSFGRDGYFPFRPWLGPSYNQFFYRSLSIDNLYRQYQNTKKTIPSIFLPSHRGKNKSSSITANQRLLLIPRVSIPRAHLQPRNVSQINKLYR